MVYTEHFDSELIFLCMIINIILFLSINGYPISIHYICVMSNKLFDELGHGGKQAVFKLAESNSRPTLSQAPVLYLHSCSRPESWPQSTAGKLSNLLVLYIVLSDSDIELATLINVRHILLYKVYTLVIFLCLSSVYYLLCSFHLNIQMNISWLTNYAICINN